MAFFDKLVGLTQQDRINDLYNKTADYLSNEDLLFYNPGFIPSDDRFKNNKYNNFISLYLLLIKNINIENKKLLDISCGRGGGLYLYNNLYNFDKLCGIDINQKNILFCYQQNKNIDFYVMDSNNITFSDKSFDIVTEIDSFYHIKDLKNFFTKINNLLSKDGIFSFADMELSLEDENSLYKIFPKIIKNDITQNIIDSCEYIINNIDTLDFSDKIKEYLMYTSKDNLQVYKFDKVKFIHYTCYKQEL